MRQENESTSHHGEESCQKSGKLFGKISLITETDSGIGRPVAIAFAREDADIAIAYYTEDKDSETTVEWAQKTGRRAIRFPRSYRLQSHYNEIIKRTVDEFGQPDILVNNAACQKSVTEFSEINEEEPDTTFRTNFNGTFFLCQAALSHLNSGASVIKHKLD
ncbi:SDR family oxidoreductase [Acetobacter musti]|uniref:SDR family oxidoreductase n=1 Tax=Acetobacter musti TaxID=864732 RepID=UPI0030CF1D1B